jgi:hypothetical protein
MGLNLIPDPFNPSFSPPNLGPPDVNRKIDLVAKSRVRLIGLCYHASYLTVSLGYETCGPDSPESGHESQSRVVVMAVVVGGGWGDE